MRRTQRSSSTFGAVRALCRRSGVLPANARVTHSAIAFTLHRSTADVASTPAASTSAAAAATTATARPRRQLRLAVVRPDLLDDWIPELNDVDAQQIACTDATVAVWWRCPKCGQRYSCTVRVRVTRGRGACPHCCGVASPAEAAAGATETPSAPASKDVASAAPLTQTHPYLAERWDHEKNGALLPSHVSAASTNSVWWKPAADAAPGTSFLRPVFAFVMNSASPAEQAAATAEMEWKLLASIREAAQVEEAQLLGSLPGTLATAAATRGHDDAARTDGETGRDGRRADGTLQPMAAEDAAAIAFLWKPRMKTLVNSAAAAAARARGNRNGRNNVMRSRESDADADDDDHHRNAAESRAQRADNSYVLPYEVFARSSTPWQHRPQHSRGGGGDTTGAVVRETLLNQYADFVCQQRANRSSAPPFTPVLNMHDAPAAAAEMKTPSSSSPSASEQPTWIDYFRLTRDEIAPRGFIDPGASLYFANLPGKSTTAAGVAAAAASTSGAASTVASPSLDEVAVTYYPRRPRSPPAWEDDVAAAVPPMSDEDAYDATSTVFHDSRSERRQQQQQQRAPAGERAKLGTSPRRTSYQIDHPFGRENDGESGALGSEEGSARLAEEYDDEDGAEAPPHPSRSSTNTSDYDDGRYNSSSSRREEDAGADLAAELRSTPATHDTMAAGESHGAALKTSSASLVHSAIAALGSALTADEIVNTANSAQNSDRYYRRGHHPTVLKGTQASPPRRFRLKAPQEGLGGQLSWSRAREKERELREAEKATSAAAEAASAAPQFTAPNTPRKVARPRRLRSATAATDVASDSAAESSGSPS